MNTLVVTAGLVMVCGSVFAQQPREKPKELEALGQYVGDWTSDVTNRPADWTPQEVKYRTANHAAFALDGWFLRHIEVNHVVDEPEKITKSLFVWTFDPTSGKYVGWTFQSSGIMSKVTGTWDAASKTFSHSDTDPPPNTTVKLTERFVTNGSIDGTLTFKDSNDGRTLFDMAWTRKRQAGVAGKPLEEHWSETGKPIEPIPDEVKKLDVFIGTRDVEFIHRPSVVSPQGNTAKGTMSGQWILDGRFLFGRTVLPNFESMWVTGYDTNKKTFRYVLFGSNGSIDESIGQWNGDKRAFDWKLVNGPPDLTRTSTTRRMENGAVESHIVAKTRDGKTHMDLTILAAAKNQPEATKRDPAISNGSWRTRSISPEMAARYEARLWQQMTQMMGFLLITWLPLQVGSIWIVKHPLARIGAGLAIVPILPILMTGFQTKTYRDGSLFGIAFMAIYVPVMIYLALFFFAGLAARAAKANKLDSAATTSSEGKQLPVVLLTLAVLFALGVLVCFFILVPR